MTGVRTAPRAPAWDSAFRHGQFLAENERASPRQGPVAWACRRSHDRATHAHTLRTAYTHSADHRRRSFSPAVNGTRRHAQRATATGNAPPWFQPPSWRSRACPFPNAATTCRSAGVCSRPCGGLYARGASATGRGAYHPCLRRIRTLQRGRCFLPRQSSTCARARTSPPTRRHDTIWRVETTRNVRSRLIDLHADRARPAHALTRRMMTRRGGWATHRERGARVGASASRRCRSSLEQKPSVSRETRARRVEAFVVACLNNLFTTRGPSPNVHIRHTLP